MKVPRYRAAAKYGFNMTPMIDVVFQLIIFFLVASHLARNESLMPLQLPTAKSGEEDTDFETPRITINVKPDGTLWMTGQPIAPDRLVDTFRELRNKEGDNLEVSSRGSRQAAYRHAEPVMWACTQAGIWNVTYAVFREQTQ